MALVPGAAGARASTRPPRSSRPGFPRWPTATESRAHDRGRGRGLRRTPMSAGLDGLQVALRIARRRRSAGRCGASTRRRARPDPGPAQVAAAGPRAAEPQRYALLHGGRSARVAAALRRAADRRDRWTPIWRFCQATSSTRWAFAPGRARRSRGCGGAGRRHLTCAHAHAAGERRPGARRPGRPGARAIGWGADGEHEAVKRRVSATSEALRASGQPRDGRARTVDGTLRYLMFPRAAYATSSSVPDRHQTPESKYTADRQIPGAFEGETVTRRRFMTRSRTWRRRHRRGRVHAAGARLRPRPDLQQRAVQLAAGRHGRPTSPTTRT